MTATILRSRTRVQIGWQRSGRHGSTGMDDCEPENRSVAHGGAASARQRFCRRQRIKGHSCASMLGDNSRRCNRTSSCITCTRCLNGWPGKLDTKHRQIKSCVNSWPHWILNGPGSRRRNGGADRLPWDVGSASTSDPQEAFRGSLQKRGRDVAVQGCCPQSGRTWRAEKSGLRAKIWTA